jgi:transketolase
MSLGVEGTESIATAVVSMLCRELFKQQEPSSRHTVVGQGVLVSMEAHVRQVWDACLALEGGFVGMNGIGASGTAEAIYRRLQFSSIV